MSGIDKTKNNTLFVTSVFLCVLFIFIILIAGVAGGLSAFRDNDILYFGNMWFATSGRADESIEDFRGYASFVADINSEQSYGRSLCFETKNTEFDVLIDGKIVYSFHPDNSSVYGKFYGSYPHVIDLDCVGDVSSVEINAETINGSRGSFRNIYIMDGTLYMTDLFRQTWFSFCLSLLIAFMGLCLIVGGLSLLKTNNAGKEIVAMGLFALDAGIWTASSTVIASILIGNPVSMHFVNYICLILLPAFGVWFVHLLTGKRYKVFVNLMIVASGAILLLDVLLTMTGISTYHDMLMLTHAQCIVAVIYSFVSIGMIMRGDRTRRQINTRITVTVAFIAVAIGSFIDLIRYILGNSGFDSSFFFRLGLIAFVFMLGINEIYSLLVYRKYETEAEYMSKLAFTDSLTGLANRMAFTELTSAVESDESGRGYIIQFDINNLKKVNDNYGHKEGDKHIKAGARVINDSFGKIGKCYRTGGDEFIVVTEKIEDPTVLDEAKDRFKKLIDDYNDSERPNVRLEIAYGIEEFDLGSRDVEGALKLADGKMYDMKKIMKGSGGKYA